MRYRISRAFRRVCRAVPLSLTLVAERLGLRDALPCEPHHLPQPHLSEKLIGYMPLFPYVGRMPSLRVVLDTLHRMTIGDYRAWRTR